MAPEYGATTGLFPVDDETLRYMRLTGRPESLVQLTEWYAKEQGWFRTDASPDPIFNDTLELDLSGVEPHRHGAGAIDELTEHKTGIAVILRREGWRC